MCTFHGTVPFSLKFNPSLLAEDEVQRSLDNEVEVVTLTLRDVWFLGKVYVMS